jgi:hypothetical protein
MPAFSKNAAPSPSQVPLTAERVSIIIGGLLYPRRNDEHLAERRGKDTHFGVIGPKEKKRIRWQDPLVGNQRRPVWKNYVSDVIRAMAQ